MDSEALVPSKAPSVGGDPRTTLSASAIKDTRELAWLTNKSGRNLPYIVMADLHYSKNSN